jgi:histidyl-tRNA synthetase
MENNELIKGFNDFTGNKAEKRAVITEVIKNIFQRYGFQPAETPIIEYENFVKGDSQQSNDEVISDIYKLKDKGNRKLALRYEFTFQLKRLMKNKKFPYKRFQIGPCFRDEPIKGNRLRQFTTCDADIVGLSSNFPEKDEAEILSIIKDILNSLKIDFVIYINNINLLNEILDDFKVKDSYKKEVIREIDKLDKITEKQVKENLKKYNCDKIINLFKKPEDYFKKYNSYSEIEKLKEYCEYYGIKINFLSSLARGLSYYNGNIFEIKTKKIKESICGGGAYEFNKTKCFGFGMSIERLEIITEIILNLDKILLVSLGQDKKTIEIAKRLRSQNKNVSIFYGKPSKALDYANAYRIKKVIFIGKKEVKSKKFIIKNMTTGKETNLTFKRIRKI